MIAYPDPPLTGKQVLLRTWEPQDLRLVRQACADSELLAGTTLPDPFTEEEGLAFIERQWSRAETDEGLSLAIEERGVGRAVGCTTLMLRRVGVADLGYWLVREARGRRLASEAVALLVPWALRGLDVEAIEAFVHPGNQPSRRLLVASGFVATGVRRHEVGRINEELMVYRRTRGLRDLLVNEIAIACGGKCETEVLGTGESGKRPTGVVVAIGIFGGIAVALLVGAILMATRLGWSLRLLSLVGAPVGVACFWFLIRGHRPTETWRESLPALSIALALIGTTLNLIFGVSPVYAVFTLSAAAGLTALTYLRFLAQMRVMKVVMSVIESVEREELGSSE